MSGVAVYSVVYPAALRFFDAFWRSLEPELSENHELFLSLHGVTVADLERSASSKVRANVIEADPSLTPAEVRSRALLEVCAETDRVVLLDSDDVVLPGRLAAASEALEAADVYACAMRLVDASGDALEGEPVFGLRPAEEAALAAGELLPRVNVFGFSNSAYRSEVLAGALPVPRETVLMDWLVASRAYLAGADLAFDPEPYMAYRQYGANTARVVPPFDPERVLLDARRVVAHHEALGAPSGSGPFQRAAVKARTFLGWLEEDAENAARYAGRLAAAPRDVYLWWQHVDAMPADEAARGEWIPS